MPEIKYNIVAKVGLPIQANSQKEAIEKAKQALSMLDIQSIKIVVDDRTNRQNNSLHKLLSLLSEECIEKGIDMRELVRDEIPIECTPENLKWLWRKLQNALFKTTSTTQLKKTGQIEKVYDNFNRIIIERTKGEIQLPPWPSKNSDENYLTN